MGGGIESSFLETPRGRLACVVHLPDALPAPVVVCCHGLLSSKDSIKFVVIGEEFCRAGLAVVRFDFSGCGESPAGIDGSILQIRRDNLRAVLNAVSRAPWCDGRISMLGSSLGGYLSLLAAAEDSGMIQAVVCWATPFDLKRIDRALRESEEFRNVFRKGTELGEPQDLDSLPPVRRILIIHGEEDETVPAENAIDIYIRLGEPKSLCLLSGGDHRLLDPECRRLARELSLDWFLEHGSSSEALQASL